MIRSRGAPVPATMSLKRWAPERELADHQQGPALADDLQRRGDRAGPPGQVGERGRAGGWRGRHGAAIFSMVSMKVKPTPGEAAPSRSPASGRCSLVALGTALVLVAYVTPMATVPQTVGRPGRRLGCPRLDAQLDERRPRGRPARVGRARATPSVGAGSTSPGLAAAGPGVAGQCPGPRQRASSWAPASSRGSAAPPCWPAGSRSSPTRSTSPPPVRTRPGSGARASGSASRSGWSSRRRWTSGRAGGRPTPWSGVVALACSCPACAGCPSPRPRHPRRLDVPGVLSLAAGLTLLVSGLTQARSGLSGGGARAARC